MLHSKKESGKVKLKNQLVSNDYFSKTLQDKVFATLKQIYCY